MANFKQPRLEGDWPIAPTSIDFSPYTSDASVDDQVGNYIRSKPVLDPDDVARFLNRGDLVAPSAPILPLDPANPLAQYVPDTGAQWAGAQGGHNGIFDAIPEGYVEGQPLTRITYGFFNTIEDVDPAHFLLAGNAPGVSRADGFSAFDADQREAARQAIETWDELVAVEFDEVSSDQADINFMNTTTGPIQASAFLPYNYGPDFGRLAGDVAVNPLQSSNHQFDEGQYGLTTLVHELGHSLGLEHPGNYNFGPGFAVNYVNGAEYYQDSNQYSIMSYWGAQETGAAHIDWNTLTFVYASTPMVHDILAIQRLYGADTTTRTGDTVYGFNSNADRDAFDFDLTPLPVVAIWDAGGTDTLDFSGWDTNSTINLNPGSYSSGGGSGVVPLDVLKAQGILPASYTQAQYDALRARYNSPDGLMHDNISIAYGAWIENAVGGGGDDMIYANAVANAIDGGAGFDTVSYRYSDSGVTASLRGGSEGVAAEGDTFTAVEGLEGSEFGDTLKGGNASDVISGRGGNDTIEGGNNDDVLNGGDGNDRLAGGNDNDTLNGGAGDDVLEGGNAVDVLNGGAGNDTLSGGNSVDILDGGDGDDTLLGGNAADVLDGGAGNDTLNGGNGRDSYVFGDAGTDTIVGYERGETIDLSAFVDLSADDVIISADGIFVDLAGSDDLTIHINGDAVRMQDILFAPADVVSANAAELNSQYMIA